MKDGTGLGTVSRETKEKLECFADLLVRWSQSINLISNASAQNVWQRHILDSAQIFQLAPKDWQSWIDIGSGGGLPGVVIAILDEERRPLRLVESDKRKCQFLRAAKRELRLNYQIDNERIEKVSGENADVLSARALAPLRNLLDMADPLLRSNGTALFPKGRTFQKEIDEAMQDWCFDLTLHSSETSDEAKILELSGIHRREP